MDEMTEWTSEDQIAGLANGEPDLIDGLLGLRERNLEHSGLDPRTHALVKVAALAALDAPPTSYAWQVDMALENGATIDDLMGVLIAIAPQVGGPRVISAAGAIADALDIVFDAVLEEIEEEMDDED